MKKCLNVVGLIALLAVSGTANALLINYDEAVDGDIGFSALNFGMLDAGTHQITGQLSLDPSGLANPIDNFLIEIPSGLQITSGTLELAGIIPVP